MQFDPENIIKKAMKGNKEAFGELVLQYQKYAFNLAFRIVCNEDDARDAMVKFRPDFNPLMDILVVENGSGNVELFEKNADS